MMSVVGIPARVSTMWSSIVAPPHFADKAVAVAHSLGLAPYLDCGAACVSCGKVLVVEARVASAYHIEENTVYGEVFGRVRHHIRGPVLRAEAPCVVVAVEAVAAAIVFGIYEEQVYTNGRLFERKVVGNLEQHSHTAGAVVCAEGIGMLRVLSLSSRSAQGVYPSERPEARVVLAGVVPAKILAIGSRVPS